MKNILNFFRAEKNSKWLFLSPGIIILLIFTIFPFLFTLFLSFSKVSLKGGLHLSFNGIKNWAEVWSHERFWNSIRVTSIITGLAVPSEYFLGLMLAWLTSRVKSKIFFRTIYLVPMALTPIAVGYIGRMMLHINRGPFNDFLNHSGVPPIPWLTNGKIAIYSIVLIDIWEWTSLMFLFLFAAIEAIPKESIEAARLDGASEWETFKYILFPLLIPVSVAVFFIRMVECFKIMDIIYILTAGGPGITTESTTLYAYDVGLHAFDLAHGATIAFSLFILVLIVSIVILLLFRSFREGETMLR